MARSRNHKRPAAKVKLTLDVEVYRPEFELFESVRHLDLAKLQQSARVPKSKSGQSARIVAGVVRAVIRKDRVTALKIAAAPHDKLTSAPPELTRLLSEIQPKAPKLRERSSRLPVSVAAFMNNPSRITTAIGLRCWSVCYKGTCLMLPIGDDRHVALQRETDSLSERPRPTSVEHTRRRDWRRGAPERGLTAMLPIAAGIRGGY